MREKYLQAGRNVLQSGCDFELERVFFVNETLKTLRERRSIRAYRPEPVREEDLDVILEAGLWAPSGFNRQTTVMVVLQDKDVLAKLEKANAALMGSEDAAPFYGAPLAILVLADGESLNCMKDGSLVMGNLMNAAASVGVGTCWINRATEYFDLPEGKAWLKRWNLLETLRGVAFCIMGYPDGPAPAPKERRDGRILRV